MNKPIPARPGQVRRSRAHAKAARRRTRLIVGSIAAVVVIAALVVAIVVNNGGSTSSTSSTATTIAPADAAKIVAAATSVPTATLDKVGLGSASASPQPVTGTAISAAGKPEVLYVGAEYCPFCAAERWPLLIALSRFGTFSNVGITHSSSTDVHPNTATLSFHGSTYTSDYIAFTPVELQTNQPDGSGGYTKLDTLTAAQQAVVTQLSPGGSIPFIDFGGKYLVSGASYSPDILEGQTAAQIADALGSPDSKIAQAVLGTANGMITSICQITGNQPASACGAGS